MDISEHDTRNAKVGSEFEFHFRSSGFCNVSWGLIAWHAIRLDIFIQIYVIFKKQQIFDTW